MNIKPILVSAFCTLCIFSLVAGCKKEADIAASRNKVRFWNNEDIVDDTISITLSGGGGSITSMITRQKSVTTCADDATGLARFTTKALNYSYSAVSNRGWAWEGDIVAPDECNIYELNSRNASARPQCDLSFWCHEPGNGMITVRMENGYGGYITDTQTAITCKQPGKANVTMPVGPHTYTATAANGKQWSGSIMADQPCAVYELK